MAPAKLNAPIKFTSPDNDSHIVSPELSTNFQKLFSQSNEKDVPPFMKLFWQEQQKYITLSSPSCIRYHPMIIKFCLNLAAKS